MIKTANEPKGGLAHDSSQGTFSENLVFETKQDMKNEIANAFHNKNILISISDESDVVASVVQYGNVGGIENTEINSLEENSWVVVDVLSELVAKKGIRTQVSLLKLQDYCFECNQPVHYSEQSPQTDEVIHKECYKKVFVNEAK